MVDSAEKNWSTMAFACFVNDCQSKVDIGSEWLVSWLGIGNGKLVHTSGSS